MSQDGPFVSKTSFSNDEILEVSGAQSLFWENVSMILSFPDLHRYINHIVLPFSYGIEQVLAWEVALWHCSVMTSLINQKTHKFNFVFASKSPVTDPLAVFLSCTNHFSLLVACCFMKVFYCERLTVYSCLLVYSCHLEMSVEWISIISNKHCFKALVNSLPTGRTLLRYHLYFIYNW